MKPKKSPTKQTTGRSSTKPVKSKATARTAKAAPDPVHRPQRPTPAHDALGNDPFGQPLSEADIRWLNKNLPEVSEALAADNVRDPDWFDKLPVKLRKALLKLGHRPYNPHPEIPGRYLGNGDMTTAEFIAYATDPHAMRHSGYSEEEIQATQNEVKERGVEAEFEAAARYAGDAKRGRLKRAMDYNVQDYVRAHHAGFRLPEPLWYHETAPGVPYHEMKTRWEHPESKLMTGIEAAIHRGDESFFRTLGAVVAEVKLRSSGKGQNFVVTPVKKEKLALLEAKKKSGTVATSAKDTAAFVQEKTGHVMSERHVARQKNLLQIKQGRPGRPKKKP